MRSDWFKSDAELIIIWERSWLRIYQFFAFQILFSSLFGRETTFAMYSSYFQKILGLRDEEGEAGYHNLRFD